MKGHAEVVTLSNAKTAPQIFRESSPQRGEDDQSISRRARRAPDRITRLEKASPGGLAESLRTITRSGAFGRRAGTGTGRIVCSDWPANDAVDLAQKNLASNLPRSERVALIDWDPAELPLTLQAELLSLNRSGLYYQPVPPSPEELWIKRRIDEIYTACPF